MLTEWICLFWLLKAVWCKLIKIIMSNKNVLMPRDVKRWAFVFPPAHFATAWCIIALLLGLKCRYNIIETWRKWTPRWCPNSELVCYCAPSVCVAGCLLHRCLQFGCIKRAKWTQFYNTENSLITVFYLLIYFCPSTSRDCGINILHLFGFLQQPVRL